MVAHPADRGAAVAGRHPDFYRQFRHRLGALSVSCSPCRRRAISSAFRPITMMPPPRWCCDGQNHFRRAGGAFHAQKERLRIFRARPSSSACATPNLTPAQLDAVVFYDKPILKFARLLETYLAVAPGGWRTFPTVLSNWLGEKLDLRKAIRAELPELRPDCPILFTEHHQSHAASAFYPSPFDEAAILTIDGVGEWATTTIGHGRGTRNQNAEGAAFSAFARAALFGVHGLLRLPHQFRRIQTHGPRALRRTEICRCHPPRIARHETGRLVLAEPGLF